ncbi:MAG: DNA polymerase IV [Acidobacteria bacterium]|nr:DNA polymerase IV [Acidobacteriota bacterium]
MDAFYASVEQRDRPELRGRPVAVGGRPEGRGVVAAASYEAREFGVRSALSMAQAVRRCPQLEIVRPDFAKYRAISQQVFDLYRAVTPKVEPLSLDEAYLDVTENAWGEPYATRVAKRLKAQIRDTTGLTASAGVAPNKFLAKIASGWQKPDGLTVVSHDRVEPFLQQLPVGALWGVGPVTERRLRKAGIERLVDVRATDDATLQRLVGSHAESLRRLAHGIDERPVVAHRERKSKSSEQTYALDLVDMETIRAEIDRMARGSGDWLRRAGIRARTVTVKVRYDDFTTITRSHTARPATDDPDEVARRAQVLIDRTDAGARPIRLLGVGVHSLAADGGDDDPGETGDDWPRLWDLPPDEPAHP